MALTVSATNLTDIDLAESATPWTTGALDPAKYVQGSNSIGWYASKNSRSVNGVSSKSIAHSAGDHLYWWNASDVISVAEPQTTGTTTASGITIRVTLSDGAYREWHVAGSDTWDGGWRCFVVDLSHTGTHLYASSGTWSTANNITDVDIYIDLSNSGNIRNVPANNYSDAIRVGTGLTCYNTSAADPAFDFADIAAIAESTTNQYGITNTIDGVIFLQGRLILGDVGGSNHLDFDSQDEVVVFSERDGTGGYGLVASTLYRISVQGNGTGTDQDVNFGVKVGTGDSMTGRNGTIIRAGSSSVVWDFLPCGQTFLHNVTLYGSTIQGATGTFGVVATQSPTTTFEVGGCTFDGCNKIDLTDAVMRNVNILNSASVSTSGALIWTEGETDIKNSLFVNNSNAVEVASLTADMTFDGMEFSGNTYDVRYEGTTDWDLNYVGGTTPSVNDASTGTLTPKQSVTITLKDVVSGSQCSTHAVNDGTELMNEAATGGDVTEGYSGTLPRDVIVRVRKASAPTKYVNWQQTAQIVSGTGLTLFVSQIEEDIGT